jgi:hypothetical protein
MFRPIRPSSGALELLLKLLHFCTLSYFVSMSYKSEAKFRLCAAYIVVCSLVTQRKETPFAKIYTRTYAAHRRNYAFDL